MPNAFPVKSHTAMPTTNSQINITTNMASLRCGAKYQYMGKATKVPTVPGALGTRPAPKPNARKCDGWLNKNRQPGFTNNSSEVRITSNLNIYRDTCYIPHNTIVTCQNFSNRRQR